MIEINRVYFLFKAITEDNMKKDAGFTVFVSVDKGATEREKRKAIEEAIEYGWNVLAEEFVRGECHVDLKTQKIKGLECIKRLPNGFAKILKRYRQRDIIN